MKAAALGLGTVGVAGVAYLNGQVPKSQLYGKTIFRNRDAGKRIALTYDDGPNPAYTPELLELLARHNAQATFSRSARGRARDVAGQRGREAGTRRKPPSAIPRWAVLVRSTCRGAEPCHAARSRTASVSGRRARHALQWGRRSPGTLRAAKAAGECPCSVDTGWDWAERKSRRHRAAPQGREGDVSLARRRAPERERVGRSTPREGDGGAGRQGYAFRDMRSSGEIAHALRV